MERAETLNGQFRTLLTILVVAAMVAPMLVALAAPARATTGPSATLTFSLGGIEETITFEDGTRSARIEGASAPDLVYYLRASIGDLVLETGTDAGVELASVTFDPFGPVGPSAVVCTDIWRTVVDDFTEPPVCPL